MKLYIRLTPKKEKMKNSRAWAFWPFLAIREDYKDDKGLLEHEEFHLWQQFAMGFVLWWMLYAWFWFKYDWKDNPIEQASMAHAIDPSKHNPYSWIKFLKMKKK